MERVEFGFRESQHRVSRYKGLTCRVWNMVRLGDPQWYRRDLRLMALGRPERERGISLLDPL